MTDSAADGRLGKGRAFRSWPPRLRASSNPPGRPADGQDDQDEASGFSGLDSLRDSRPAGQPTAEEESQNQDGPDCGPGEGGSDSSPAEGGPDSGLGEGGSDSGRESGGPQLALYAVNKVYPGHPPLRVLQNVDVEIGPGEFVAVVGPSGSGKTTMLSIMGTLDQPTSGQVWIEGIEATAAGERERARLRGDAIGFVFQQFFLLPALTALDNVATGMLYQGFGRAERRRRAHAALDRVGLAARAGHRPGELSGGEQQRVAIARAIAGEPRVLFADEPTGALDQASGHMVVDYLRSISGAGTTVVVITHDQTLAARFDRTITILDGAITSDTGGPARRRSPVAP
ncbi:MAG: ABC transporter ATP-binding protein [Propionibacteriaceae bacterium]|jgi:putative ABC transport system ATP-binding protein|nr:ABC transporter ATP-binding protein [Propionibacteriaceae bacterium]